jgi:hypothetical protein
LTIKMIYRIFYLQTGYENVLIPLNFYSRHSIWDYYFLMNS